MVRLPTSRNTSRRRHELSYLCVRGFDRVLHVGLRINLRSEEGRRIRSREIKALVKKKVPNTVAISSVSQEVRDRT
jgi:hypothetical protein